MSNIGIIYCGDEEFHRFMFDKYAACVTDCGGAPEAIRWDADESAALEKCAGFIFTGGGDIDPKYYGQEPLPQTEFIIPQRDEFELDFIKGALASGKPVLGICRGMQLMNVALGGTLYQDYPSQRPDVPYSKTPRESYHKPCHSVLLESGSALFRITGKKSLRVNSLHHQAVKDAAPGLVVTARTPEGLIEGVEMPLHPFFMGVQWHPEHLYMGDESSRQIFRALIRACG